MSWVSQAIVPRSYFLPVIVLAPPPLAPPTLGGTVQHLPQNWGQGGQGANDYFSLAYHRNKHTRSSYHDQPSCDLSTYSHGSVNFSKPTLFSHKTDPIS